MRTILLPLFLFGTACLAAERPFDFGLSGRVTIAKATYWMDGGSVSVVLRDEHGNAAHAGYRNNWMYDAEDHGGQFSYSGPTAKKITRFRRFGADERELVELLRGACVATFGTSDPQELKTAGGWDRLAMSSLFRQASSRHISKKPR